MVGGFWLASCFISSRRPSWFSALRLFGRSSASPGSVLAISVSFSLHRHPHPAVINVIWLLRVRTLSTHCRCMSALRQETIFFPTSPPRRPTRTRNDSSSHRWPRPVLLGPRRERDHILRYVTSSLVLVFLLVLVEPTLFLKRSILTPLTEMI